MASPVLVKMLLTFAIENAIFISSKSAKRRMNRISLEYPLRLKSPRLVSECFRFMVFEIFWANTEPKIKVKREFRLRKSFIV